MRLPSLFRREPAPADLPPVPAATAAAVLNGAAILSEAASTSADPSGPLPPWAPGLYTVTYERVADYGQTGSGIPPLMPLVCHAKSPSVLAEKVADDVAMLVGLRVSAVVDQAAGSGRLLGDGAVRVGSFIFAPRSDTR